MGNEISLDTKCTFIKANGERCQAHKLRGSDFCYFHSPQVVVERAEARRRGGLSRHGPKGETGSYLIKSPADVLTVLEDTLNDAYGLDNTAGRAKAIGYLCQIILKGFEGTEVFSRLEAIEERLKKKGL